MVVILPSNLALETNQPIQITLLLLVAAVEQALAAMEQQALVAMQQAVEQDKTLDHMNLQIKVYKFLLLQFLQTDFQSLQLHLELLFNSHNQASQFRLLEHHYLLESL